MAVKLIGPTEPILISQLCVLAYGQPGSRKSSLAQTAKNPITLAFDPGIYRAYGRKAAAMFETWQDVLDFDPKPYQTVVVDTIGMCLQKLSSAIIAENPKHGNRLGGLTLQGYGQLKSQFAAWVGAIRQRGQDLLFLSQEKVEKNGDEPYYCPDIVGSSYNTMMDQCDMVGYMHFEAGHRVIDFSPTDRWMAKAPPCGWTQKRLPDFSTNGQYLAELIAEAKASMGKISAESAALAAVVTEWEVWLVSDPTIAEFNGRLPSLKELSNGIKAQVWHLIQEHAKKAELVWDKDSKCFLMPNLESTGAA